MPNHYTTVLIFVDEPTEPLKEFLDSLVRKADPVELCEHLLPMPELLKNTAAGGVGFDGVQHRTWYTDHKGTERPFTDEERAELAKLGAESWYDWAVKNWGTKWGTYGVSYDDYRTLQFNSAWGPPHKAVFKALFDKFKESFEVYGYDEGYNAVEATKLWTF